MNKIFADTIIQLLGNNQYKFFFFFGKQYNSNIESR